MFVRLQIRLPFYDRINNAGEELRTEVRHQAVSFMSLAQGSESKTSPLSDPYECTYCYKCSL